MKVITKEELLRIKEAERWLILAKIIKGELIYKESDLSE